MTVYSDTKIPSVYYTPENPNEDELVMTIDNSKSVDFENGVYITASNNDSVVMHMCVLRSDIIIGIAERTIRVDLLPSDGTYTFYVKELEILTDGQDPTEGLDIREHH